MEKHSRISSMGNTSNLISMWNSIVDGNLQDSANVHGSKKAASLHGLQEAERRVKTSNIFETPSASPPQPLVSNSLQRNRPVVPTAVLSPVPKSRNNTLGVPGIERNRAVSLSPIPRVRGVKNAESCTTHLGRSKSFKQHKVSFGPTFYDDNPGLHPSCTGLIDNSITGSIQDEVTSHPFPHQMRQTTPFEKFKEMEKSVNTVPSHPSSLTRQVSMPAVCPIVKYSPLTSKGVVTSNKAPSICLGNAKPTVSATSAPSTPLVKSRTTFCLGQQQQQLHMNRQENKSISSKPAFRSPSSAKETLLLWIQQRVNTYPNMNVTNFSTCWSDGLAFCALIHYYYPEAFDYNKLDAKNRCHNFTLAFKVAEDYAGICPLLDVEDMVRMKKPDWKCVFTYVQSFYRRFNTCKSGREAGPSQGADVAKDVKDEAKI